MSQTFGWLRRLFSKSFHALGGTLFRPALAVDCATASSVPGVAAQRRLRINLGEPPSGEARDALRGKEFMRPFSLQNGRCVIKRVVLLVLVLLVVSPVVNAGSVPRSQIGTAGEVSRGPNWSTVTFGDGSLISGYAATYTVWYRFPGQRWHGYSGYSYYDACQVRDSYLRRGAQAYIERD
jgi:hypothetical protein